MSTEAMKLQEIMSQAQVFASAWSLVGGRFDGGNAMDEAEVAKNELHQMVAEALAQPQQEPVAWVRWEWNRSGLKSLVFKKPEELSLAETATGVVYDPLYTSPPARKPLTNEEIENILPDDDTPMSLGEAFVKFARAIEAAHGIKENT